MSAEGVRWKPFFGQRFYVERLSLRPEALRSLPSLGSGLPMDASAFSFRDSVFAIEDTGGGRRLRILRLRSSQLEFRGALDWKEGAVQKAGIAAIFPSSWAEKLPEHWEQRLSSASGGRKTLKCAYGGHRLTFYGRSGPLVRAAWTPE